MFSITAMLNGIKTTEGNYKNKTIAERNKRRLEKKNKGIVFKLRRMAKTDKNTFKTFKAIRGHIERGEL